MTRVSFSLSHRLHFPSPHNHYVEVETTVRSTEPIEALTLFMPVWTPGSYLVREYARHVEGLVADLPARGKKLRKNAWRIDTAGERAFVVRYRVYANDLTVRTNHVDETHAYLNGAAVFLAVEGAEASPARVEVIAPEGWRVATALPVDGAGFTAPDLDTLVDSPIEVGTHREERFEVLGVPHRYAIWPAESLSAPDVQRVVADTRTILETEAKLFGGKLPYDQYLFLLHVSPRGRGGLEHKNSSTLLIGASAFGSRDGYLDYLSLVAHEAFHAWNVKRIRPEGLFPYRYQEENYTRLLWWFEGATSYYDWRVLRLARLCTVQEYLDHLGSEILYLDVTYGRLVHALEEASFDAWIKLYRPDENSSNSSVSYYRKGELVCALLDIEIRHRSQGRSSLDHVLAHLWEVYGSTETPVPEAGMQEIFERVTEVSLGDLFDAFVRSASEIDYASTLAKVGLGFERIAKPESSASLGLRLRQEGGRAIVSSVLRGGAGHKAGIDPGDEIVAVGGKRLEGVQVETALAGRKEGEKVEVTIARDGKMATRAVTLDAARAERVRLVPKPDASPQARAAFVAWLGESHAAWDAP
jgi:predicted metalloprotease with PDZ domain